MKWLKAGLAVCVAFGLYQAMAPKAPPPPDTAISPLEVKLGLQGLFEYENRICYDVPRLPQGRFIETSRLAMPVRPGGRRPHLDDLVKAGVVVHASSERTSPGIDTKWVEIYRVAPRYRKDYHHAKERGRLCFARLAVDQVLSVQRVAPKSSDHRTRLLFRISDVADWVLRLPPEARGDAQGWIAGPTRESSLVFCHGAQLPHLQPSRNSGIITYGMTCAGAYVEDEPSRVVATGPEPVDDQQPWTYWNAPTYTNDGDVIER